MALRLAVGEVTVLLGPAGARRRVMDLLDDSTGRCAADQESVGVVRLTARRALVLPERRVALDAARRGRPSIVLVDRFTDGLDGAGRRALLGELRALAVGGCAVLIDDADPVAALAVAGHALRVDASGELVPVPLTDPDYLAS